MAQQQKGAEGSDYYDIIVMGMTGMGKSTTADKLIIANPTGKDYSNFEFKEAPDTQRAQTKVEDISMWLLSETVVDAQTRLKFLAFCRKQGKNSHERVNKVRRHDPTSGPPVLASTKECEVISNDTSKVRVMDIPGFFDGDSVESGSLSPGNKADSVLDNNLGIMRKVLHVQTALRMKFRRILYFLPVRGPLERASAILKWDLKLMAHYFGKSILQCMVVVATISSDISELPLEESKKFSERAFDQTKFLFKKAIKEVFPQAATEEDMKTPPIIFISLTDSCEAILKKVKDAPVTRDNLVLEFDPSVCADCGVKIGEVNGEKVACCFGEDWSAAIPYSESTCHPVLIPKYSRFDKFKGGFVHVVTFGWARGKQWPIFEGEVCAGCREEPGKPGCMLVGREFPPGKKRQKISVDHTHEVQQVNVEEAAQGEQQETVGDRNETETQTAEAEHINPHFNGQPTNSESAGVSSRSPTNREPTSSYNCFNEEQKGT